MRSIADDVVEVLSLGQGDECYIAWSEEGGGEVHRIWDKFFLFEIPQFGGEGYFVGHFSIGEVEKMVRLAHSWA